MAISINYPDKIIAGLWQSYTITSDEGPPQGEVLIDEAPIEARIISLRPPIWKVTFLIPRESAGKKLALKFRNGGTKIEETKAIEAG